MEIEEEETYNSLLDYQVAQFLKEVDGQKATGNTAADLASTNSNNLTELD